jgi:hypothetical protein
MFGGEEKTIQELKALNNFYVLQKSGPNAL